MLSQFPKFLMSALMVAPLSFILLTEDCTHQKRKTGNQTGIEAKKRMDSVKTGLWGGEHISLEVTADGATVDYDCAHGSIDQKIILNERGRFSVAGTHVRERGGPVRKDDNVDTHPAKFSGQIENDTMMLTVTETDTKESVGTYKLIYGAKPSIMKCK